MKPFTKKLVLENGKEFPGYGFGANRNAVCEIVFNTSITHTHFTVISVSLVY